MAICKRLHRVYTWDDLDDLADKPYEEVKRIFDAFGLEVNFDCANMTPVQFKYNMAVTIVERCCDIHGWP